MTDTFKNANTGKIALEHIYNEPDPRQYFRTLRRLDYELPDRTAPVFRKLFDKIRTKRNLQTVNVLDVGCSYGINGALLRYDLTMASLYERYTSSEIDGCKPDQLRNRDCSYLKQLRTVPDLRIIGLDRAERAVAYAVGSGFLDRGVAANLEEAPLSAPAADAVAPTDLVISTGCVGYVTERTFDHILEAFKGQRQPWVASFVLRMFSYQQIADMLAKHKLITEQILLPTFVQRCFASNEEQDYVMKLLGELGIDAANKEAEGCYHASLFISRPANEVDICPLSTLLNLKATQTINTISDWQ